MSDSEKSMRDYIISAYKMYVSKGILLNDMDVKLVNYLKANRETFDDEIKSFIDKAIESRDKAIRRRMDITKHYATKSREAEEAREEAEKANQKTEQVLIQLRNKSDLLEAANTESEQKLKDALNANVDLRKSEGMLSASKIGLGVLSMICVIPAVALIMQITQRYNLAKRILKQSVVFDPQTDSIVAINPIPTEVITVLQEFSISDKPWDVYENNSIYALGVISGLILSYAGYKKFGGSEGRSNMKAEK